MPNQKKSAKTNSKSKRLFSKKKKYSAKTGVIALIIVAVAVGLFIIGRKTLADQTYDWTNINTDHARLQICKYERRNIDMIRVRVARPTAQLRSVELRASRSGNSPFVYGRIDRDRFREVLELNDKTEGPNPTFTFRLNIANANRPQNRSIERRNISKCESFNVRAHDIPNSILAQLRQCESSNNYSANTGNGYYGAYQFNPTTWHDLGRPFSDYDNANQAPDYIQDAAVKVRHKQRGNWNDWPGCGNGLRNNFETIILHL